MGGVKSAALAVGTAVTATAQTTSASLLSLNIPHVLSQLRRAGLRSTAAVTRNVVNKNA